MKILIYRRPPEKNSFIFLPPDAAKYGRRRRCCATQNLLLFFFIQTATKLVFLLFVKLITRKIQLTSTMGLKFMQILKPEYSSIKLQ